MGRFWHVVRAFAVLLLLLVGFRGPAEAVAVLDGQYKLPASVDPTVSTDLATELWAHVFRPAPAGNYPLLVFLHGNHGTCGRFDPDLGVRVDDNSQYTFSGTCPSGYVVTPNHRGYDYLANKLASEGYVVVSINANRGVNAAGGVSGDSGLNLRRGRLVLRHLQQLAEWNESGGAPPSLGFDLAGLLDFADVGLMGHSRGGEGMRAAVAQYKDPGSPWPARIGPVTFKSLFEIGPVDGQTSRILNALGMVWNVLLPACDGDVSDLQGVKPLDRMMRAFTETGSLRKSSFQVFGANHNFYNTEWQLSDASGCQGQNPIFPQLVGSPEQRQTAVHSLIPFFRATVGPTPDPIQARRFDPSFRLPNALANVTDYARGFTPTPRGSANFIVDDFNNATGTSSAGVPNQSSALTQYQHGSAGFNHDPSQRAAAVNWSSTSGFLQVNAAAAGSSVDVSSFRALEFRVALRCFGSLCSSSPNPTGDVDFSIALADGDGTLSTPITLKSVAIVRRPAGEFSNNTILQTVRIRLSDFVGTDLSDFRGVRFSFNRTATSSIFLANVRLTRRNAGPGGLPDEPPQVVDADGSAAMPVSVSASETNAIVAVRSVASPSGRAALGTEIELSSTRLFPIGGALPTLSIGDQSFTLSRFPPSGKTDRLIFTLEADEYAAVKDGAETTLRIGGARPWAFGKFRKR
jgi:hypothetical protein